MYFGGIPYVKFNVIPFPERITKIQQAEFCFEFKPDPGTDKIAGITGCIKICMSYAHIREPKKVRINAYKIPVFCSKYAICAGINTFFVKTAKQPVSSY